MDCPENTVNSTECLLRALLAAQSSGGFDWDPLNFSFTAGIGVLALLVAGLTIFQGLLSSGPGRIKASKEAIGSYAEFTRTRFSWTELRLRTRTKIPFLNILSFTEAAEGPEVEYSDYPARWRTLIGSIGCKEYSPNIGLIDLETDYLPPDVQAAPAWATIETVMILAGLAGCNNFSMARGSSYPYPEARGPNSQLRFREHPDLGPIAVFNQLSRERIYRFVEKSELVRILVENYPDLKSAPTFHELKNGRFLSNDIASFNSVFRRICPSCDHPQCSKYDGLLSADDHKRRKILVPLVARSPLAPRVLKTSSNGYLQTLQYITNSFNLVESLDYVASMDMLAFSDSLHPSTASVNSVDFMGDEYPLYTFDPEFRKGETKWTRRSCDALLESENLRKIVLGWLWLRTTRTLKFRGSQVKNLKSPFSGFFAAKEEQHVLGQTSKFNSKRISGVSNMPKLVFINELVPVLERLIQGEPDDFDPLTRSEFLRIHLQIQLQELDVWLNLYGGGNSVCQLRRLVVETIDHMNHDELPYDKENPFRSRTEISQLGKGLLGNEILEDGQELERGQVLRIILILRAIVWTAYVHTAGDISFLYTKENASLRSRIVQVL